MNILLIYHELHENSTNWYYFRAPSFKYMYSGFNLQRKTSKIYGKGKYLNQKLACINWNPTIANILCGRHAHNNIFWLPIFTGCTLCYILHCMALINLDFLILLPLCWSMNSQIHSMSSLINMCWSITSTSTTRSNGRQPSQHPRFSPN